MGRTVLVPWSVAGRCNVSGPPLRRKLRVTPLRRPAARGQFAQCAGLAIMPCVCRAAGHTSPAMTMNSTCVSPLGQQNAKKQRCVTPHSQCPVLCGTLACICAPRQLDMCGGMTVNGVDPRVDQSPAGFPSGVVYPCACAHGRDLSCAHWLWSRPQHVRTGVFGDSECLGPVAKWLPARLPKPLCPGDGWLRSEGALAGVRPPRHAH